MKGWKLFNRGSYIELVRSEADLEIIARNLQLFLWDDQDHIWKKGKINAYLDILEPETVFTKILGYELNFQQSLGMHIVGDELVEVAGLIDKK